jgi:hypothetical protein
MLQPVADHSASPFLLMNNSGRAPGTPHANNGAACPGNGVALSLVVLGVLLLLTLGLGVPSFLYHCLHLLCGSEPLWPQVSGSSGVS